MSIVRKHPTNLSGLSLIELLIAIAIMGIVGSMASGAYSDYVNNQRIGAAITQIRAAELLIHDYRGFELKNPATLADVGFDLLDPWGNPYQYLDIEGGGKKTRKDKNLTPINTDFDLYSMGPDGKSTLPLTAKSSRDDIVRANNGRYVGVANGY